MASSVEILVASVINDLFSNLCNCSFLSVPYPAGMLDKHPLTIWQRKFGKLDETYLKLKFD